MYKVMVSEESVVYRQRMRFVLLASLTGLLIVCSNYFVKLSLIANAVGLIFFVVGGFLGFYSESLQLFLKQKKLSYEISFAGWKITSKEDDFSHVQAIHLYEYCTDSTGTEGVTVEHAWELILACNGKIKKALSIGVFTTIEKAIKEAEYLAEILNVNIENHCDLQK